VSMPAVDVYGEFVVDPDELKVPESPQHRQISELIAIFGGRLLGPDHRVYRDMNWYPLDEGTAIAPDVMVLPAGVLPVGAKSYQQAKVGGPAPTVVFEVPSATDGYGTLHLKLARYRSLNTVAYVVAADYGPPYVSRRDPDGTALDDWDGRPIPELADLVLSQRDNEIRAETPDGLSATNVEDLLADLEANTAASAQRAEMLAEKLRALGVEPPPEWGTRRKWTGSNALSISI